MPSWVLIRFIISLSFPPLLLETNSSFASSRLFHWGYLLILLFKSVSALLTYVGLSRWLDVCGLVCCYRLILPPSADIRDKYKWYSFVRHLILILEILGQQFEPWDSFSTELFLQFSQPWLWVTLPAVPSATFQQDSYLIILLLPQSTLPSQMLTKLVLLLFSDRMVRGSLQP